MLKCNVKFLQQSLECNKCDKKFESHEKNFKCEKCNSVFGNNCLLKSHVKKIHEKNLPNL